MRPTVPALGLALSLLASTHWDPAEQARLGRGAWRNAMESLRAGDSTAALVQLRQAHEAWPTQPSYSEALVRLAARLGDAPTATRTLDLLALQGLGATAAADSAVAALASKHPAVATARQRVLQSIIGPERSATQIVSADTLFFPEGLSVDGRDGTLFVSSLRHGNVWVVPATGAARWLLPQESTGRAAVFGVKLAADGQSLWLTLAPSPHMGSQPADSSLAAELWQVDRASAAVLRRVRLGDGRGIPGELALVADGSVLVSDAVLGRLYRLRVGATLTETIESPLLRSPQGIAVHADGLSAVVADWSHGLLRWDLVTNEIRAVEAPSTMALLGIDGLLLVDGTLVAVQNGVTPMRVLRARLDDDASRVLAVETLDRPADIRGEFTVAAAFGREILYVASSSWPFWNDRGERIRTSGALPPVTLRRFTLPE